jgi:hypothetical protein
VDNSPGCSVKDSFASINLGFAGFRLLFQAGWIHRRPVRHPIEDGLTWTAVRTPDELRAGAAAHGGGAVFRPTLLDNPTVAILVVRDGDTVVAGVIGNRSTSVVGISDLFTTTAETDQAWASAAGAISVRFPDLPPSRYQPPLTQRPANRLG